MRLTHVHFEHSSVSQILNCQVQGRVVCSAKAPPMSVPIYRRLGIKRGDSADIGTATPRKVDLVSPLATPSAIRGVMFGGGKN